MAELPAGTVTFLFTDLEGSTRLWEEHPEAMQAARMSFGWRRHISSVESWGWTPDVPVRSSGLRQRACRAELVALGVLHDGPGARVLEGIRVRAGPRASAFAVASANRPGGHPAATSTSAFRQIVVSPIRCRAAVAVACDRRGARMVPLSARLTLLLNPGSLANWRLKWWNGFPERPDGLFRHRCMAQGGAFRFQGCTHPGGFGT